MFGYQRNKMVSKIRDKGQLVSIFDKVQRIEKDLNQLLPEMDRSRLIKAMSKCRQHYEGKLYYGRRTYDPEEIKKRPKLELSEIEKIIYHYLIENDLNPSTTYRWFLATRLPSDIKERLSNREIPVKLAMSIAANRRRIRVSNQGLLMMDEMVNIIGGL